jgi:lysophospholipase L1-like esterase
MPRHESGNAGKRMLALLAVGVWLATAMGELMANGKSIVYIEASTVHNWKLDQFPGRTGTERYRFQVLREYEFDKSKLVDQVLTGGQHRPDAVIVQECAVYFPGDMQAYQRMYRGWIESLQARGLRPVIATVVPPARSRGWWQDAKDFVKERLLGRPGKLEQVVAFNEWLRKLGEERKIPVFDLERLLRVSADDRHMRAEYNAGDGIHLAPVAYQRLDKDLLDFLDRLEWSTVPR